jgi:hypothetical protein
MIPPLSGGMCNVEPEITGVTLAGRSLALNTDYLFSFAGCEFSLTLLEAAGPIGPDEHLIITYQAKADSDTESGALLTNVAGATEWFNNRDKTTGQTYNCTLTDDDCHCRLPGCSHDSGGTFGLFLRKNRLKPNHRPACHNRFAG